MRSRISYSEGRKLKLNPKDMVGNDVSFMGSLLTTPLFVCSYVRLQFTDTHVCVRVNNIFTLVRIPTVKLM